MTTPLDPTIRRALAAHAHLQATPPPERRLDPGAVLPAPSEGRHAPPVVAPPTPPDGQHDPPAAPLAPSEARQDPLAVTSERRHDPPAALTAPPEGRHGRLVVALPPPPATLPVRLTDALADRHAHYRFGPLGIAALGALLGWAAGPQREVVLPDGTRHRMRANPTAGGLPSVQVHVVAGPDQEIPAGVHRYTDHGLVTVSAEDPLPALRAALVQPEFADRAPVTLVLTGDLAATMPRYPARHYRTLHIDAGILAQNLWLVATALDLACCAVSGFHDDRLATLLHLPQTTLPLLTLPLGGHP